MSESIFGVRERALVSKNLAQLDFGELSLFIALLPFKIFCISSPSLSDRSSIPPTCAIKFRPLATPAPISYTWRGAGRSGMVHLGLLLSRWPPNGTRLKGTAPKLPLALPVTVRAAREPVASVASDVRTAAGLLSLSLGPGTSFDAILF